METVALHEIGHALGLRHSDVNNSVMEEIYEGERRDLTQDDIVMESGLFMAIERIQ